MEDIRKIAEAFVAMLFAAYGLDALRFAHLYLDQHFPKTGAAKTNTRAKRDARLPTVRANNLMHLDNFLRASQGRELHVSELLKGGQYANPQHLSYDLRRKKDKDEVRMVRKGYYRWVHPKAVA